MATAADVLVGHQIRYQTRPGGRHRRAMEVESIHRTANGAVVLNGRRLRVRDGVRLPHSAVVVLLARELVEVISSPNPTLDPQAFPKPTPEPHTSAAAVEPHDAATLRACRLIEETK